MAVPKRKQTPSRTGMRRAQTMKYSTKNIVEDNLGILKKKQFYNKDDMEEIKIVEASTEDGFRRNSFIYDFLSSMRQKINDPIGQRAKKRKAISQR